MRPKTKEKWEVIPRRRRWGCLVTVTVVVLIASAILTVMLLMMRPEPPIHAQQLIGTDVDGLVLFELSDSSGRVARFLDALIRPLSYDAQTRPEEMAQDIRNLLNILTYRRAIGLLRFDPQTMQDQWAVVVALKRMGDPIKILVKEIMSREQIRTVETVTSGGVLLFWPEDSGPYFAINRRAFIVASTPDWLDEVIKRLESPLSKTPRANRLYLGLPRGGKHCLMRANILILPERYRYWLEKSAASSSGTAISSETTRLLEQSGFDLKEIENLTISATLQPRGQMQCDVSVLCKSSTATLVTMEKLADNWNRLRSSLLGPYFVSVTEPTTGTRGISFVCTTPPIDEIFGLNPTIQVSPPNRDVRPLEE